MKNKRYTKKINDLSPKELAGNFVFPSDLNSKQQKVVDAELSKILAKRRESKSDKVRLQAK